MAGALRLDMEGESQGIKISSDKLIRNSGCQFVVRDDIQ